MRGRGLGESGVLNCPFVNVGCVKGSLLLSSEALTSVPSLSESVTVAPEDGEFRLTDSREGVRGRGFWSSLCGWVVVMFGGMFDVMCASSGESSNSCNSIWS